MRTKTLPIGETAHRGDQAGFTLFELLAVMVIASLAVGAITLIPGSGSGTSRLKATVIETAARLRDARAMAINQGRSNVVLVDLEHRIIVTEHRRKPLEIDSGIQTIMTAAAGERRSRHIAGVRFFPNGSSTGAILQFAQNRQTFEVRVNWLTGWVAVRSVP